jgi:capping protein beta
MADPFDAALDLLRRLPPSRTSASVAALASLRPDLTEDLLESVDVPLATKRCRQTGRDFLCCDYNRDGDSWRSPWSNAFEPPLEGGAGGADGDGGVRPGERVRAMEVAANEAFEVYRELYYEGGVASCYFWDVEGGFAGCVLLKKGEIRGCASRRGLTQAVAPAGKTEGSWDSIHVFEVQDRARRAHYKLTSTVILNLGTDSEGLSEMDLSGNMVRQVEQDMPVEDDSSHVANIGRVSELAMSGLTDETVGRGYGAEDEESAA